MILVTLSVSSPPGQREEMVERFWTLLGPVRVEPGCLACALYKEAGDPDALLYIEQWETPEQLERHTRSARYERVLAVMEASARPPALRYHMVSASKGMEYLQAIRLGAAACAPPARDAANTDRPLTRRGFSSCGSPYSTPGGVVALTGRRLLFRRNLTADFR